MTVKTYLIWLAFSVFVVLSAWVFVIFYIDPEEAGVIGEFFFYTSLFLFLLGTWVSLLVWLRAKFFGEDIARETMKLSFRQGALIALFVVAILFLKEADFLIWWVGLLVATGFFLTELYFLIREDKYPVERN